MSSHILIFEPRSEGHHLSWLRYITEDFLYSGFQVTLAISNSPPNPPLFEKERGAGGRVPGLIDKVEILPVFDKNGNFRNKGKLKTVAVCLKESGASHVLMPNFDEVASNCMRFAAFGIYPPKILKNRLSGIYHRPRPLAEPMKNPIKSIGLWKLLKRGWFEHIYLLDEYLLESVKKRHHSAPFYFIPDPCCGDFYYQKLDARHTLEIPADKFILLNYGIPARRKGLHIAVRAMLKIAPESNIFLLCAGQMPDDNEVRSGLEQLKNCGMAHVIDRFISDIEEKLCFCASDAVILPYIRHFGSSAVLSRAVAAGKMVIASDFGLIAKRVRDHNLGWLFPTENVMELKKLIKMAAKLTCSEMDDFRIACKNYTLRCSREAFRKSLLLPFGE